MRHHEEHPANRLIIDYLTRLNEGICEMSANLDALNAKVADLDTVVISAVAEIEKLKAGWVTDGTDEALPAVVDLLSAIVAKLSAAIAPPVVVEPPPVEEPAPV